MRSLLSFLLSFLVLFLGSCDLVVGLPPNVTQAGDSSGKPRNCGSFFPGIVHGLVNKFSNLLSKNEVWTPFGPIKSIDTGYEGVQRYVVQYATVDERWSESRSVEWGIESLETLPPMCPQTLSANLTNETPQSESCLYLTIYTPASKPLQPKLPVLFWIHGGSFIAGGSSQPGLEGSRLAAYERGMIVVIVQYRLGILGLLPPSSISSSDPNLALLDLKSALRFSRRLLPSLGGDVEKITVVGHSSGGQMVRALLASPDMRGLFRGAIIQYDPMAFGFSTPNLTKTLQGIFYGQKDSLADTPLIDCSAEDIACWRRMDVGNLVQAQEKFIGYMAGEGSIEGVPAYEVLRPTTSTPSLRIDLSEFIAACQIPNPAPLLITTVKSDAGVLVQALFPDPIDDPTIARAALQGLIGIEQADSLMSIPEYDFDNQTSINNMKLPGVDGIRSALVRVLTDGVWRCPSRNLAKRWLAVPEVKNVWVGEWTKGKTYPTNEGGTVCRDGVVCHEDDILPTFGQGDPDLVNQALSHWSAFVHDLDPGGDWHRYTGESDSVHLIGGGSAEMDCPIVWGEQVQYDP